MTNSTIFWIEPAEEAPPTEEAPWVWEPDTLKEARGEA
jgi:hypothetical protein